MTRPLPELPADPLGRFISIGAALEEGRGWTESALAFRFATAALVTTQGSPNEIANGLRAVADDLKARAGWFGPMRSSIRFLVAAILLRNAIDPAAFDAACSEINDGLRERKLRRNRSHALLAALILVNNDQQRMESAQLDRMAEGFHAMKEHHPWITNAGDYAPCALLATTDTGIPEMMQRIEAAYEGLRQRGYSRGDRLQRASHLMFFNPAEDRIAADRLHVSRKVERLTRSRSGQSPNVMERVSLRRIGQGVAPGMYSPYWAYTVMPQSAGGRFDAGYTRV